MEEDEIEQGYEDEKQKVMDEYLKNLESDKNHEKAEKAFNTKMEDIIKKYNQLMLEKIGGKGKNNKFMDFINKTRGKFKFVNRK